MPVTSIETRHSHTTWLSPQVSDTDYGGGVYHGRYFAIYNQARDQFISDMGFPYQDLMAQGLHLAVAQINCQYLLPIRYAEKIKISSRVSWYRSKSLGMVQKMESHDGQTIRNRMEINLVCVDSSGASVVLPQKLTRAIDQYHG